MTNKKLDKFIDVFFPSEDLEKVDINLIKKFYQKNLLKYGRTMVLAIIYLALSNLLILMIS